MIDRHYLEALLPILKKHGVSRIKTNGLELEFHVEQVEWPATNKKDESTQVIADALKKQEESMPPDLRADALMDQDKILNWSSPDQKAFEDEPVMPLTGEQPL